jgi:transcriptional regulator with XRE-family HTH domain
MAAAFSLRLRRLRKNSSLTMDELARAAGISKSYVWELENREVPHLSAKVLVDLAKALDVTLQDLLFFRKYLSMDRADKDRLKKMIELFEMPTSKRATRGR